MQHIPYIPKYTSNQPFKNDFTQSFSLAFIIRKNALILYSFSEEKEVQNGLFYHFIYKTLVVNWSNMLHRKMLSLRKSASAMNLRKTDRSELNLFPALSFLVVCFIGGYFLWATKDALPSEADNTDFRYAPSRAKELPRNSTQSIPANRDRGWRSFWRHGIGNIRPTHRLRTTRTTRCVTFTISLPPSSIPTRRFVRGVSGAIRPTATSLSNRN